MDIRNNIISLPVSFYQTEWPMVISDVVGQFQQLLQLLEYVAKATIKSMHLKANMPKYHYCPESSV